MQTFVSMICLIYILYKWIKQFFINIFFCLRCYNNEVLSYFHFCFCLYSAIISIGFNGWQWEYSHRLFYKTSVSTVASTAYANINTIIEQCQRWYFGWKKRSFNQSKYINGWKLFMYTMFSIISKSSTS